MINWYSLGMVVIVSWAIGIAIAIFVLWEYFEPPDYGDFFGKDSIDERKKDLDKWQK